MSDGPAHVYGLKKINNKNSTHQWLLELHNDPLVLNNLTHPTPVTMKEHLAWWKKIRRDKRQMRCIFTIDGQNAGMCKFYDIDDVNGSCVLGADLHADFRGKGHAIHMWERMLELCFVGRRLHRVSLTTAEFNEVARYVYTKLGFKEEGRMHQSLRRDGKYHDQVCMRLLRDEWESRRR